VFRSLATAGIVAWASLFVGISVSAQDGTPASGQPAQPSQAFPSIAGVWQEAAGIFVRITQSDEKWKANCSFNLPDFGEVRWQCNGTITPDGKVKGVLLHSLAPERWKQTQVREGKLSDDGNTISGTASWDNALHPFTWTRLAEGGEPTTPQTPAVEQLQSEVERLRQRAALAKQALDTAHAAAFRRLAQTPEYQQAEAAVADAQNEMDGADSGDARAKAATDKLNAKTNLTHLQENAFASDATVVDATKSNAEASDQFKLAQARLEKAQADEAAAESTAEAAAAEQTARAQKKVVLSAHDFDSLPVFKRKVHSGPDWYFAYGGMYAADGTPLGFAGTNMNAVGYIGNADVVEVVDDSTAIIEVLLIDPRTGVSWSGGMTGPTKQIVIEGMPTAGQADNNSWRMNCWFKIVATRKYEGGTYMVAWQILKVDKTHPVPTSAGQ
jgi:hypothetical protein